MISTPVTIEEGRRICREGYVWGSVFELLAILNAVYRPEIWPAETSIVVLVMGTVGGALLGAASIIHAQVRALKRGLGK